MSVRVLVPALLLHRKTLFATALRLLHGHFRCCYSSLSSSISVSIAAIAYCHFASDSDRE